MRLDDDDLVGRGEIEHAADLIVEEVPIEVIGPHIGGAAFELGALGRDIGEPRLCQPQFLGCAHPRPQPAIALDEVISEIPGERQTQHGGDEHLGAAAHFAEYDHRKRESLGAVCVNTTSSLQH